MFGFVTLVGRNGARLDPELVQRLQRVGPEFLPFRHERTMRWENPNDSVIVLGWEAFTEIGGIGSHWCALEDGLTAFTGYCWPLGSGWSETDRTWAEQLDRWLTNRKPADALDKVFGQFDLLRFDRDGRGAIVTDFLSCGPLFTTELRDCTVISNRSGLAALAATPDEQAPVRSPLGTGWMIFDTPFYRDDTGYLAAEHLLFGAWSSVDPERGAEAMLPTGSPFDISASGDLPHTYETLVPLMVEEARSHMQIIARLPVDSIGLRLSGGKDSRLVAAAAIDAGLRDRVEFSTFGPPEKSDPLVARMIADGLGLCWTREELRDRPGAVDIDMVHTHTFLTEGMHSGWNTTAGLHPHNTATLTGVGGDYIGWRPESTVGLQCHNRQDALEQLMARPAFDRYRLLRPEAKAWYLDGIVEWMDQRLDQGLDPSIIRALFLREGNLHGHTAITTAVEPRLWIDSLCAPIWFRASFQLPPEQRPEFRFHVDIIEQLCPRMLDYPLANAIWTLPSYAHRPDRERFAALEEAQGPGGTAQNWRVVNWEHYRPLVQERLLEKRNPVFQVLDYKRIEWMLRKTEPTPTQMRSIYSALTAVIWLGEGEDRRQIGRTG